MSASSREVEGLAGEMARRGVKLPLVASADEPGSVVDADGNEALVIDVNSRLPDDDAAWIAAVVARVINLNAGFAGGE